MSMNQHTRQECAVEIAVAIVSQLSSLRELSRARMINRTFRDGVSLDLGSRIRSIVTGQYVSSEDYDGFRALLSRTDSVLMGKWAELLAGPSNSWSDIRKQQRLSPSLVLLVACPRDSMDEWREYLVNHQLLDCGFAETYVGRAVRSATCFSHQYMGGAVVVLESETRSSMSIVLAQKGSCNRRGINKSYVFDLHPAVTARGENVETGRESVSAMSTCAVECTGRWMSCNADIDLSRTLRTNVAVRRPKGGALPTQSSFAPESILDVTETKRKYEGMGFPVGLFYGTQVGKVECVPVPSIVPCKDQYSEWDLRYDVWLRCPVVAQHVLYWGDLSFERIRSSDSSSDTGYLLCTNDPSNENANENTTVYSVLKVMTLASYNVCCELLGVFPADFARFGYLAGNHLCRLRLKATSNDESRYMEMLGRLLTPDAVDNHRVWPSGLYLEGQFITIEVTVPKTVEFRNRGNLQELLAVTDLCDEKGQPRMVAETAAAFYHHGNIIAKTMGVGAQLEMNLAVTYDSRYMKVIMVESIETRTVGAKWYDTPPCRGPVGVPLFQIVDNVEGDETDEDDGPLPSESRNDSEESVCQSVLGTAGSDVPDSPTSVSLSSVSSATPDTNGLVASKLFREDSPASSRIEDTERERDENGTTILSPHGSVAPGQSCVNNFVGDLSNVVQSVVGPSTAFGPYGQEGPASWNWNVSGATRPWELDVTDPVVLKAMSRAATSAHLGVGAQGSAMGLASETTGGGYSNVAVGHPYVNDVATASLAQVGWTAGMGQNVVNRTMQDSCTVTPASFSSDRKQREGGKNRTASHSTASSSRVTKPEKAVNKSPPKKRVKRQPWAGEHQFVLKAVEYRFMPVNGEYSPSAPANFQGQSKSTSKDCNSYQ
ncbi:hypothetical protein K435DRAFT_796312 [Dendrothele bispora CBS 962.96]|uniref:Uncharacterized protein n=1 Tax=Dendrothele bispora (strain CBS 962.96) TaxID=1314807 RepID=A0A4S8M6Q6_DENBC|nr:hypothetical protein K435DRAFT_796312 [Dendrothele bispora CBS 962.96]